MTIKNESLITSILTHPGGSHKDEFLACCVLLARNPTYIERREPTDDDLADPATCVVDVGHRHEPELHNFDHHQLPKDAVPTCALSLILQYFEVYDDAKQFYDWLEPAEWFDCRGPSDTAEWLGVPPQIMNQLNSPIDISLRKRFASSSRLEPGDPLWEMMKMIGEDILGYLNTLRERLDFIDANIEIWYIKIKGESVKCLFIPRSEPVSVDPSMGIIHYVQQQEWKNIIGLVCADQRGNGYGLSRFHDDPRLDFTQIEDEDDVHFAHARGFVAKTSATDVERLKQLVLSALVKEK